MYNPNKFLLQKVALQNALKHGRITDTEYNTILKQLEHQEEEEIAEYENHVKKIKEARRSTLYDMYTTT